MAKITQKGEFHFDSLSRNIDRNNCIAEGYLESSLKTLKYIHDLGYEDKTVEIANLQKALTLFEGS